MPQIVAAALAKSAMAAPVVTAAAAPTLTAAGTTAALELAKQQAIQAGMQQMAAQGTKQLGLEATKQAVAETAKQSAVEASKQGIAQGFQKMIPQAADDAASLATQSGSDAARNQVIEAFKASQAQPGTFPELGKYAGDVTSLPAGPSAPAGPLSPAGSTPNLEALKAQTIQSGSPSVTPSLDTLKARVIQSGSPIAPESQLLAEQAARMPSTGGNFPGIKMTPDKAFGPQSSGTYKGIDPETGQAFETLSRPSFNPPTGDGSGLQVSDAFRQSFGKPPEPNSLQKGFETALGYVKDNPVSTGLSLMTAGQYLKKPEQEDKDKYKSTVDMSDFQPSIASVEPFKPSYEYQKYAAEGGLMKYAVGGPVETMSAQNAVGGNMQYPQAGLQTALYSNPMVQRPESVNVISPGEGPAVGAYSGEQKFAEGGLSAAERREYGLQTRSQRASRSLTKSYEEKEKEREKELMNLLSERSDPGIIPRSRRQQLGFNPFATAAADYAGLAKKNKVPVAAMPKTSLGDIETYMDVPIEAAGGGIMHGLGGYSDGGRLLRGPGDGVSDSIPAVIGKRQPARLADGEFVIPARIVSELGNGSTEAGARKLYAMMERVQKSRKKSIGKKKVAVNSKADKHLPA
jgi:hypothetical protein